MKICLMDSLRAFPQTGDKAVQGVLCSIDSNKERPGHEIAFSVMKYVSTYQFQWLGCVPLNGHNTYISNPMMLGVGAVSGFSVLELML